MIQACSPPCRHRHTLLIILVLSIFSTSVSANSVTSPARASPHTRIQGAQAVVTLSPITKGLVPPTAPRPPAPRPTRQAQRFDLRAVTGAYFRTAGSADSPTAPPAEITPVPGSLESADGESVERLVQTTYYSCATIGTYTHCGWHEPILDASTNSATGRNVGGSAGLAVRVLAVASAVALFLWQG
jgi:hypothetical protein